MSTLGATRIHTLSLHMPRFGALRADVVLEGGDAPTVGSSTTLTVGDLSLAVTVLHSDLDAPDRPHVVVVNGGGWERPVATAPSYQSDVGVRLVSVLRDLASRAGETIELPADVAIGAGFAAPASRAGETLLLRDVLSSLSHAGYLEPWRVDADGVTRFGARVGVPITARATVLRRNAGVGLTVLGIDSPAAFLPGNLLDGAAIVRTIITETSGKLEAEVYADKPALMTSILRKVAEAFPALFYSYPRTYVVAAVRSDKRLDLIPPPDAQHLPELSAVEQWSLGGALVTPALGAQVCVLFRDANPTRPIVQSWGLGTPTSLQVDASDEVDVGASAATVLLAGGGHAVARVGDSAGRLIFDASAFTLYYSPSAIAPYVAVAPNLTTPVAPVPLAVGTPVVIATGSGKVASG